MAEEKRAQATRFSEHFHKVRLTSIILSISLFLFTLYPDGKPLGGLIGEKIPPSDIPFAAVCLLVAAVVSFVHMWVIWIGEVKDIDASLQPAGAMFAEVRDVISKGKSTLAQIESLHLTSMEELQRVRAEAVIPFPIQGLWALDAKTIMKELLEDGPLRSDGQLLSKLINAELESFYKTREAAGLYAHLANGVSQALGREGIRAPVEVIRAHLEAQLDPNSPASEKWHFPISIEDPVWNGAGVELAISSFIGGVEQRIATVVSANQQRTDDITQRLSDVDGITQRIADRSTSELLPRLAEFNTQLEQTLKPLARAVRTAKTQFYIFDLLIPAFAFGLAFSHAIGRIFSWESYSASGVINAILHKLNAWGTAAEALTAITIVILLAALLTWIYQPRWRKGHWLGSRET